MLGNILKLADELGECDFIEAKSQIEIIIEDSKRMLAGLEAIGLGKEELATDNLELELEETCLWVPASVHHHVAGNSSCFVYGGVRVMPRVN